MVGKTLYLLGTGNHFQAKKKEIHKLSIVVCHADEACICLALKSAYEAKIVFNK